MAVLSYPIFIIPTFDDFHLKSLAHFNARLIGLFFLFVSLQGIFCYWIPSNLFSLAYGYGESLQFLIH